jgi:hypothetical protein
MPISEFGMGGKKQRFFAEFTLNEVNVLRMTAQIENPPQTSFHPPPHPHPHPSREGENRYRGVGL